MHFDPSSSQDEPMAVVFQAVKETTRAACHLADVAGRLDAPAWGRIPAWESAAQASLEAGLRTSRALFSLEDALARQPEGAGPVLEALASLQAAEEALHAARGAIEARVSRTLQPGSPAGATPHP